MFDKMDLSLIDSMERAILSTIDLSTLYRTENL